MNIDPLSPAKRHVGTRALLSPWTVVGSSVVGLAVMAVIGWLIAPHLADMVSFKSIGLNYEALRRAVDADTPLAVLYYIACYAVMGLFYIPGSAVAVVISGLLFGSALGIPVALVGSVIAATLGYMLARLTAARLVDRITHPALGRLREGFHRHELSYMMFLRLTPGLPFNLNNIAPALLGVKLSTFVIGTTVGLLPSRIALSTAGAGLAHVIAQQNVLYSQCVARSGPADAACDYNISIASLLTWQTMAAFVALAALALVPAMLDALPDRWRTDRRRSGNSGTP
jgi:uncharacterized membrane protein YdjX (TVP38/TMEM64 family)